MVMLYKERQKCKDTKTKYHWKGNNYQASVEMPQPKTTDIHSEGKNQKNIIMLITVTSCS